MVEGESYQRQSLANLQEEMKTSLRRSERRYPLPSPYAVSGAAKLRCRKFVSPLQIPPHFTTHAVSFECLQYTRSGRLRRTTCTAGISTIASRCPKPIAVWSSSEQDKRVTSFILLVTELIVQYSLNLASPFGLVLFPSRCCPYNASCYGGAVGTSHTACCVLMNIFYTEFLLGACGAEALCTECDYQVVVRRRSSPRYALLVSDMLPCIKWDCMEKQHVESCQGLNVSATTVPRVRVVQIKLCECRGAKHVNMPLLWKEPPLFVAMSGRLTPFP